MLRKRWGDRADLSSCISMRLSVATVVLRSESADLLYIRFARGNLI